MRNSLLLCTLGLYVSVTSAEIGLKGPKFEPLPVGSDNIEVAPKGWLKKQLRIQAEGLSGHLSQFWDDIKDSVWIGGTHDGDLHERVPYWLNGVVGLGFLLEAVGEGTLPGVRGIYKSAHKRTCTRQVNIEGNTFHTLTVGTPADCELACLEESQCLAFVVDDCSRNASICHLKDTEGIEVESSGCMCSGRLSAHTFRPISIMNQTKKYINYILSHSQTSGWIGPVSAVGDEHAYWGPTFALLALCQYAEGMLTYRNDTQLFNQIVKKLLGHLLFQTEQLKVHKLQSWAKARWQDLALPYMWLLDHGNTVERVLDKDDVSKLMQGIELLHDQGLNWEHWFQNLSPLTISTAPLRNYQYVHNVNNAQALKSSAVWYRFSKKEKLESLSLQRMHKLDELLGLPTGMFNGDEWFPIPPTRHPSHGIELCGVVEAMFSYTTMFSIHGEIKFADRAERIAYNALPATWASPTGGDMWAHQYIQAVNQINAIRVEDHIWQTDGPMAETYGLEPNFGCCTANFNQGWPKFANMAVFRNSMDGGIVLGIYAPMRVHFPDEVLVDINTKYPFEGVVDIIVDNLSSKSITLNIRIPSWATKARVEGLHVLNGTFHQELIQPNSVSHLHVDFAPEIRVETWDNGVVSFHRGALMYSLNIAADWKVTAHHFGTSSMSNDYSAMGVSPWNYAVDVSSVRFKSNGGYTDGTAPFNHTNWPNLLLITGRKIKWHTHKYSAANPPNSPLSCKVIWCGDPETLVLVPHGGTDLRIGLFPTFITIASEEIMKPS